MEKIFISYSRLDQDYVEMLKPIFKRLKIEHDLDYYQDVESLIPGEDFEALVKEKIESSTVILCFLSNRFFASNFIQNIELPLIEKAYNKGGKVIPLLVEEVHLEDDYFLQKIQRINWTGYLNELDTDVQKATYVTQFEKEFRLVLNISSNTAKRSTKARYNIVVMGKSGVGKSELVNYMFGEKVMNTDVGKPVTEMGFHASKMMLGEMPTTVLDSAGLEIGKHQEWMDILDLELKQRGPSNEVSQWFHTVLYCVSAAGSRIEYFELDLIRKFHSKGYHVIIVITKAFIGNREIELLKDEIQREIDKPLRFVSVNSLNNEVEVGEQMVVIPSRGRLELFKEIEDTLVESLIERIPARCIELMQMELTKKSEGFHSFISNHRDQWKKNRISDYIKKKIEHIIHDIKSENGYFQRLIDKEAVLTLEMYVTITGSLNDYVNSEKGKNPLSAIAGDVYIPKLQNFWDHLGDSLDEVYDWDVSDQVGEYVDMGLKIFALPVALVGAICGATWEYVEDQLKWENSLRSRVDTACEQLKEFLSENEEEIKKQLRRKLNQVLG